MAKNPIVICASCGAEIDKSACNQTYGICTTMTDSDECGLHKVILYLCRSCNYNMKEGMGIN